MLMFMVTWQTMKLVRRGKLNQKNISGGWLDVNEMHISPEFAFRDGARMCICGQVWTDRNAENTEQMNFADFGGSIVK